MTSCFYKNSIFHMEEYLKGSFPQTLEKCLELEFDVCIYDETFIGWMIWSLHCQCQQTQEG